MNPTLHPLRAVLAAFFTCAALCGAARADDGGGLVATAAGTPRTLSAAELQLQLWSGARVSGAEDFLAGAGPKQLHFVVQRAVDAERVGVALMRALKSVSMARHSGAMAQLGMAFSGRRAFARGDSIVFELAPGLGLRLLINKAVVAESLGDASLMEALARSWVAPQAGA